MDRKKPKPGFKSTLHPEGLAGLPGPVVELEFDTSRPIAIDVGRKGNAVGLILGKHVIGMDHRTAQQLAETLLKVVADIRGVDGFLYTLGTEKTTVRKGKGPKTRE